MMSLFKQIIFELYQILSRYIIRQLVMNFINKQSIKVINFVKVFDFLGNHINFDSLKLFAFSTYWDCNLNYFLHFASLFVATTHFITFSDNLLYCLQKD